MKITIISPTRIEIDDQDAGMPLDVFLAREDLRQQIREEFVAWHGRHVQKEHERELDARKKEDDIRAECAAKVAAIEADMAVLGTKEEAQKMRAEKRRKELIQELATLDGRKQTGSSL